MCMLKLQLTLTPTQAKWAKTMRFTRVSTNWNVLDCADLCKNYRRKRRRNKQTKAEIITAPRPFKAIVGLIRHKMCSFIFEFVTFNRAVKFSQDDFDPENEHECDGFCFLLDD